jgi:hypothetical protein
MFRATHVSGPLAGEENDTSIVAPVTPDAIWYAPAPQGVTAITPNGYIMVGWSQEPEVPWPGQVKYVLDRERSDLRPHHEYGHDGMEEGTAIYVLAP